MVLGSSARFLGYSIADARKGVAKRLSDEIRQDPTTVYIWLYRYKYLDRTGVLSGAR